MIADAEFQSVELFSIEYPLNLLVNIGDYRNDLEKCKLLLHNKFKEK